VILGLGIPLFLFWRLKNMEALRILKKHNKLGKYKKNSSGATPSENVKQE